MANIVKLPKAKPYQKYNGLIMTASCNYNFSLLAALLLHNTAVCLAILLP